MSVLMAKITDEVGLKHPITYDIYDLCELHQDNKLSTLNISKLKNILSHLDISFKSKEKKVSVVEILREVISECECDASHYEHLKLSPAECDKVANKPVADHMGGA